jgi:hypothetical protein
MSRINQEFVAANKTLEAALESIPVQVPPK